MGALLRARFYAALGKTRDLAQAYKKPSTATLASSTCACSWARPSSSWGSRRGAPPGNLVLDVERTGPTPCLLQARALAESGTTPTEKDQQQQAAIARLEAVTKANPRFEEAFHTLAEIHLKRDNRAAAVAVLKEDLKANPTDAAAAAR